MLGLSIRSAVSNGNCLPLRKSTPVQGLIDRGLITGVGAAATLQSR